MSNLLSLLPGTYCENVYTYFDRIRVWLRKPLHLRQLKSLERQCVLHVEDGPAWFDPIYQQKLEIYQPSDGALQCLARLPYDVLLNYLEVTCDFIMADEAANQRLLEAFKRGFLQPWHRSKRARSYPNGGYTTRICPAPGERRTGCWFEAYIDKPNKLSGEVNCFHIEGRYEGRQLLRSVRIEHPRDLVDFDFDQYFSKHLKLYHMDHERLGRYHHNKLSKAKRRRISIGPYGYNCDRARGMVLYRALSVDEDGEDCSLQSFVDRYGRGPFLTRPPVHLYVHLKKHLITQETAISVA
jgi:hypothetical protein